jgi:perosamine synthetase
MKVSVNEIKLEKIDIENVQKSLEDGWCSSAGPVVLAFEEKWAAYCDRTYGIAMSNGTTSLLAALLALGLEPKSEILVPNFTIISCANAIIQSGNIPIFVDCELETFNLDTQDLEDKITSKTRAILFVDTYGHPANIAEIKRIAAKYSLKVVEDAAEAHGAEYLDANKEWQVCGSEFEMSTFSFFANKLITTGEGGMVLTNDENLSKELVDIRNLYFTKDRNYLHKKIGYQFRLTSMQAALGINQIDRLDEILAKKRALDNRYRSNLATSAFIKFTNIAAWAKPNNWVIAVMFVNTKKSAVEIREMLKGHDIETRPFFSGMHTQESLEFLRKDPSNQYINSEFVTEHGVILPSGINTSMEQVDYVCEKILSLEL